MIAYFDQRNVTAKRREDGQLEESEILLLDEQGNPTGTVKEFFRYKPQKPKGDKIFPDRVVYSEQHWIKPDGELLGVKRFHHVPEYKVEKETPEKYGERKAQEELEAQEASKKAQERADKFARTGDLKEALEKGEITQEQFNQAEKNWRVDLSKLEEGKEARARERAERRLEKEKALKEREDELLKERAARKLERNKRREAREKGLNIIREEKELMDRKRYISKRLKTIKDNLEMLNREMESLEAEDKLLVEPAPKPEPAPKVEAAPAPKPEPAPEVEAAPKVEAKPEPAPKGKGKWKGKGKSKKGV